MDDNHSNLYPPSPYPKKKPKKSWVVPMLIGIIIGILLVTVTTLVFVLPDAETLDHDQSGENQPEEPIPTQENDTPRTTTSSVNVDVTTQVTDVVEKVSPGVVGVTNIQLRADFWQQQDGNEQGTGSGVIYKIEDEYAYVVTNYHVIEGADTVEVVLVDETHIEAEVLGSDMFSDLAVLRMDSAEVDTIVEMGSSEHLKVGEPAIAIGNPLGHMFSGSVTLGVISGTQRTIPVDFDMDGRADWQAEVIQTDAAINPGNSGGALINIDGQLIGINSMKINQTAVEGIGFAIPIDTAQPLIKELEERGEVVRPYLGIEIYSLDEVPQAEWQRSLKLPEEVEGGIYIWSIEPFSPADEAGLKRLDVITALDGEEIMGIIDLRKVLYQEKEIGDELSVTFYRDGKKQETTVKLSVQQ
ncbi:MAG TPA: trypsin-like peptidase domain-containing protein [Candidatus Dormibacteraeota bacterium]|nr:trypsin-like peptidase domain-containing protein [Candidatus Dormibacteraeota bacterium]